MIRCYKGLRPAPKCFEAGCLKTLSYRRNKTLFLGLVAIIATFLLALMLIDFRLTGFTSTSHCITS